MALLPFFMISERVLRDKSACRSMLYAFSLYDKLMAPIDRVWASFRQNYRDHISCRPGCSSCCEKGITFFPLEVYWAAHNIGNDRPLASRLAGLKLSQDSACGFLLDEKCAIYPYRPMLCRTFGLPVMYMEGSRYLFDICCKNLEGMDIDELKLECVLNMDSLNSRLVSINRIFSEITGIDSSARYTMQKLHELIK